MIITNNWREIVPSNIIEAKSSDYSLELVSKDASGHPTYTLRRLRDNVAVATIRRYTSRLTIPIKGTRLIRHGRQRNFWQWSFNRDHKPTSHRGMTSYNVESRADCVRNAIWFLEN
jgi:hypothetical protein